MPIRPDSVVITGITSPSTSIVLVPRSNLNPRFAISSLEIRNGIFLCTISAQRNVFFPAIIQGTLTASAAAIGSLLPKLYFERASDTFRSALSSSVNLSGYLCTHESILRQLHSSSKQSLKVLPDGILLSPSLKSLYIH